MLAAFTRSITENVLKRDRIDPRDRFTSGYLSSIPQQTRVTLRRSIRTLSATVTAIRRSRVITVVRRLRWCASDAVDDVRCDVMQQQRLL